MDLEPRDDEDRVRVSDLEREQVVEAQLQAPVTTIEAMAIFGSVTGAAAGPDRLNPSRTPSCNDPATRALTALARKVHSQCK